VAEHDADGRDEAGRHAHRVFCAFYSTPRAGQVRLAGGGGPLGFDITAALQIDHLIRRYDCDALVETGCHLGDTSEYLGRAYPDLPVWTCDIDATSAAFTRRRVAPLPNVAVHTATSPDLVDQAARTFARPFLYLDAHWLQHWPLLDELRRVRTGVVCIDDFDIGLPRFAFDHYDGVTCGPALVAQARPDLRHYFAGNPHTDYPYPCLQVGRRAGRGYLAIGLSPAPLQTSQMFTQHRLPDRR